MAIQEITLTFDKINDSIQIGDTAYFSAPLSGDGGGFDISNSANTKKLGKIVDIMTNAWNIGEGKLFSFFRFYIFSLKNNTCFLNVRNYLLRILF